MKHIFPNLIVDVIKMHSMPELFLIISPAEETSSTGFHAVWWRTDFYLCGVEVFLFFVLYCRDLVHQTMSIFNSNLYFFLSLHVSDWYTHSSQRFHAPKSLNGSAPMANKSIVIDFKVAGLENCLNTFEEPEKDSLIQPFLARWIGIDEQTPQYLKRRDTSIFQPHKLKIAINWTEPYISNDVWCMVLQL